MLKCAVELSGTVQSGCRPRIRQTRIPITINDTIVNGSRPSLYCCRLSRSTSFACIVTYWLGRQHRQAHRGVLLIKHRIWQPIKIIIVFKTQKDIPKLKVTKVKKSVQAMQLEILSALQNNCSNHLRLCIYHHGHGIQTDGLVVVW